MSGMRADWHFHDVEIECFSQVFIRHSLFTWRKFGLVLVATADLRMVKPSSTFLKLGTVNPIEMK